MFKYLSLIIICFTLVGCNGGGSSEVGSTVTTALQVEELSFSSSNTITTPEPTSMALLGSGLLLAFTNRKRLKG